MKRLLPLALLVAAACSGDKKDKAPKDVYEAVLWDSTYELSSDTLAAMDIDTGDGTLRFTTTPPQLVGIQPGRVLIAGKSATTPKGLLRFVMTVTPDGDGMVLTTIDAPLQLAFKKLHVEVAQRTATINASTGGVASARGQLKEEVRDDSGGGSLHLDFVAYDGDGNTGTTEDQVSIVGDIGGSYDYSLGIDVDWGIVDAIPDLLIKCPLSGFTNCTVKDLMPSATIGFGLHARADASATLSGAPFLSYKKDIPIVDQILGEIVVGPLVFFPELQVIGHVSGAASSQFTVSTGAHAGFDTELSFSTDKGITTELPTPFANFDTPQATVTLSAQGSVGIETRVRLALYDVLGPYAGLTGYANIKADQEANPCWTVDAGIQADFGFDIGVNLPLFGYLDLAKLDVPLNLAHDNASNGACILPPDASTLPPGAGPDNSHLLNPTFTPYAEYTTPTDYDAAALPPYPGYINYVRSGTHRSYRTRTVDGALLISSIDAQGVTKVREDGSIVWASQYNFADDYDYQYRVVSGVASLGDATIAVATNPYGLVRLDQDGSVVSGIAYDIPLAPHDSPHGSDDGERFWDVVSDDQGGVYIVATQTDATGDTRARLWISRMNADGEVLWSKRFGSGSGEGFFPSLALANDGGLIVAGNGVVDTPPYVAFLLHLNPDASVAYAKRLPANCGSSGDALVALGGTFTSDGGLVLAGAASDYGASWRMRVDGSGTPSGFVAEHRTDLLNGIVVYTGIAELPSGGFVGVGYGDVGSYYSQLVTARIDAALATSNVHTAKLSFFTVGTPQLLLTDDGGALITDSFSSEYDPGPPDGYDRGGLFVAKLPAKDVTANWRSDALTAATFATAASTCTMSTQTWAPAITDYAPTSHATTVTRSSFNQPATSLIQ